MNIEVFLIGTASFLLVWEKLPAWGSWFNKIIGFLPGPLQTIYYQLHCPYCAGFWLSLGTAWTTGFWTLDRLGGLAEVSLLHLLLARFLDALVSATLIHAAVLTIRAISLFATKSHLLNLEIAKKEH